MSKDGFITFTGVVIEKLPNANFLVKLDENGHVLLTHLAGKLRKNNINVYAGDSVDVDVSPYDLTKGRIVFRRKQ